MNIQVITGPTCSGKSSKAVELAKQNNALIISCDSVQVYKGMDIGSAKITMPQRCGIEHFLIDVVDVDEVFDVAKYIHHSKIALNEIIKQNKNLIVVGGSGFYLKAWFSPVVDNVFIPEDIVNYTQNIYEEFGNEGLVKELLKIDENAGSFLDIKNPRRTIKALQRCISSKKSVEELLKDFSKLKSPICQEEKELIILDVDNDKLQENINLRTKLMIEEGLVSETQKLIEQGILNNSSARNAIGYKETIEWIKEGSKNIDILIEEIARNTFKLVKKQRKFFRNNLV